MRDYPAKVLLFGEHTVLRGGRGLAVPYPDFALRWEKGEVDERLLSFCTYLKAELPKGLLHTKSLEADLKHGWRLAGDIPTGYGLGSSGAVCAAIWDRYLAPAGEALTGEHLRQTLALMEQHFHGHSSGTDPLICYLNTPVMLGGGQRPTPAELPKNWSEGFFLLDTGIERQAEDFISRFIDRYDGEEATAINKGWTEPADAAIAALLAGDREGLHQHFKAISTYQREAFSDFIPTELHDLWMGYGYVLKLCGAGGGGMMLGLSGDREATELVLGSVKWL